MLSVSTCTLVSVNVVNCVQVVQGVEPAPRPVSQEPPSVWAAGIALGLGLACAVAWRQLSGQNRCCHFATPFEIKGNTVLQSASMPCQVFKGRLLRRLTSLKRFAIHAMQVLLPLHTQKFIVAARRRLTDSRGQCLEASAQPLPVKLPGPPPKKTPSGLTSPTACLPPELHLGSTGLLPWTLMPAP